MHTKTVPVEKLFQSVLCPLLKDNFPKLQIDDEVEDDQEASIRQDREPIYTTGPLLLEHAISKDAYRVHHVKKSCLHQRRKKHHKIAKEFTVAIESLVCDHQVAL